MTLCPRKRSNSTSAAPMIVPRRCPTCIGLATFGLE